ncbi:MAG: hypothetical protein Q9N67_09400 [Ghiorsea sp.]|nr:hypothetical protein [Ghiorsea sp.]
MRYALLFIALFFPACTDFDKSQIDNLLDQRNISINQKNIEGYSSLLSQAYLDHMDGEVVQSMQHIFKTFEKIEMVSRDRRIQINSEEDAICEQTYVLKVFADNEWRKIVKREQLKFKRENGHWKISSGL